MRFLVLVSPWTNVWSHRGGPIRPLLFFIGKLEFVGWVTGGD